MALLVSDCPDAEVIGRVEKGETSGLLDFSNVKADTP